MILIQFIADYGKKDPAFAEVMQRLMMEVPSAVISEISVSPFSTEETGFWIAQLALAKHPDGMIVYSNTAPRKDKLEGREKNAGEGLVYAKLKNGVEVVAVNSGYSMSMLKQDIVELWEVDVDNDGTQFRSRDNYPQIVGKVARKDYSCLKTQLNLVDLADYPVGIVVAIDGYGNIKTSWTVDKFTFVPGDKVKVKIGNQEMSAFYADGTFSVKDGEISFAPGSSGHYGRLMEVFLRGGSAANLYSGVKPGDKVEVSLA
jgi:S-adenosylmethionine hydrolase